MKKMVGDLEGLLYELFYLSTFKVLGDCPLFAGEDPGRVFPQLETLDI